MPRSRQASMTPPSEWLRPAKASNSSPRATTLRLSSVVGSVEKVCVSCMTPPAIRRMARAPQQGRFRLSSRGPQLVRHGFHDRERFGQVLFGVRQRETGVTRWSLPRIAMKVDAAREAAGGETTIQLVVVVERVRPGPHRFADPEVDAE